VPNRVVVEYTETHARAAAATRDAAALGMRNLLAARSLGELDRAHRFELLDVSASGVQDAIEQLQTDEHVEHVEPDYLVEPYAIPNDLFFDQQWGHQNTGQFSGIPDADVDSTDAWDIRSDCRGALVAVIDGPLALPHEDLSMWVNPGEDLNHNGKMDAADLNGVDDDGDGFVDDVSGWDFLQNDNDVTDQTIDAQHATAISGIIGAHGNNGLGMAGVCWAADILPLRFMQGVTGGSNSDAIRAIDYAVARGAKVINASWGGDTTSTILEQAIAAAGNAGTLFVAAAGNSARDVDQVPTYPAGFPEANIVSVIASDPSDHLASSFSNFGANNTDLAAPGVSILGTTGANGYTQEGGTSFAAPWVTGAAALLFAAKPGATVADVKDALLASVDKLPALSGLTSSGGRLNIRQALLAIGGSSGGSFHARIQAEDYTAFNETTPSVNYGAAGSPQCDRHDGVDMEATNDQNGRCNVGWTTPGEWLEYGVDLPETASWAFSLRSASGVSTAKLHLELDGVALGSRILVQTDWQDFRDVRYVASLASGHHTLRVVFETQDVNLNYIDIQRQDTPVLVPARIEAENYMRFNETDELNHGAAGSPQCDQRDGVDLEATADNSGRCNIGWSQPGEYLEYDISVPDAGTWAYVLRTASGVNSARLHLEVDGASLGSRTLAQTDWQVFRDITYTSSLSAGKHTLRVAFETQDVNLNYITIGRVPSAPFRIQGEDYLRYSETDSIDHGAPGNPECNKGDGVDAERTSDNNGVCNVGWTRPGEYLEYDLLRPSAASWGMTLGMASGSPGNSVQVLLDGASLGTFAIPQQGWQTFENIEVSIPSVPGGPLHTVRVLFPTGEANLNYIDFH
jgi:hypothetical protein